MVTTNNSHYGLFWGDDILKKIASPEPIIDHMLWEGDNVILIGKEKVGKSILALELACCLTTGEPFLDIYDIYKPREVLYIQAEGKRAETQERLENMMLGIDCNLSLFSHLFLPGLALDTADGINRVKEMLLEANRQPEVVIIDPLYMTIQGSLSNSQDAQAWIKNIRELFGKYNSSLIIIHHKHRTRYNKSGDSINEGDDAIFGSFAWKAFPDHVLNFQFINKKKKLFVITCDTQRSVKVAERIECKLFEPQPLLFTQAIGDMDNASIRIRRYLEVNGNCTFKEIEDNCKFARSTVYRALKILKKQCLVAVDKTKSPFEYFIGDFDIE